LRYPAEVIAPARTLPGSYEELASEYYDPIRHPTCARFREASRMLISRWLGQRDAWRGQLCEVGAGDSVLAEALRIGNVQFDDVLLTDASPAMLRYSTRWRDRQVHLAVADAASLPLEAQGVTLVVASLGDPYNAYPFWREVRRVLRDRGECWFTTPSHEWATALRQHPDSRDWAVFEDARGTELRVWSRVLPELRQIRLIESAGLVIQEVRHVARKHLRDARLAPKLGVLPSDDRPVVTGYRVASSVEV
jgi:SAM-dependent methyltransferase